MSQPSGPTWLLLLPQLPPQPSSLRVRVWRRLQQIGAVAMKNAAYALPENEATLEDFTWLRQEILDAGGGALLLRAEGVGEADREIRQLFAEEREQDYRKLTDEATLLAEQFVHEKDLPAEAVLSSERALRQLRERLERIRAIDFFSAPAAETAEAVLERVEQVVRARTHPPEETPAAPVPGGEFTGRLWVTRAGVYVDRLACAWMIRRFIDPEARFAFLRPGEEPPPNAIPFDMAGVEYGHHGAHCSLEVLAAHFRPTDVALRAVAEVVHDLDLKDEGFGRQEAAGLKRLLDGVCSLTVEDAERLRISTPLFEALYAGFA